MKTLHAFLWRIGVLEICMMVLMHTFTIYDSDFCDLVPHIVFNDLDINCIIIKEHRDKIFSPQAAGPNHNGKMVLLHKFGYHCDALAQETFNKYWRPGCAHLESYLSAAISPTSRHTEQCDDESQDFIKVLQIHRKENPRHPSVWISDSQVHNANSWI